MEIDRRRFLALSALAMVPGTAFAAPQKGGVIGCAERDGGYVAARWDWQGGLRYTVDLPERGHGLALRPGSVDAVFPARRPETFCTVINAETGSVLKEFDSPDGRHFYGHGAFDPTGQFLYTPENDYDAGRGVIGVWDAADGYRRVGEFDAGGIGPHETILMPDGKSLAVCIGGIDTHPDYGREMLNLPTMEPALTFVDLRGNLLAKHQLPHEWHRLSLRHLSADATGTVLIGGQYAGPLTDLVPLVVKGNLENGLEIVPVPEEVILGMAHYCGSVALSDGEALVTCPRGNLAIRFPLNDPQAIQKIDLHDVCGAAVEPDGFALTTGTGIVTRIGPDGTETYKVTDPSGLHWDNHLAVV